MSYTNVCIWMALAIPGFIISSLDLVHRGVLMTISPHRVMRITLALMLSLPLLPAEAAVLRATVFAPGVISSPAHEGPFAFTPDGQTIYFVRFAAGMPHPEFRVSHLRDGQWSEPENASFPEDAAPAGFCFSPDGERLYFTHAPDSKGRLRLWVAERDGKRWKNARPLAGVFEEWDGNQASPSVTADGTLYFTSNRAPGSGGWDVYRSAWRDGQYQPPELLGGGRYSRISTMRDELSVAAAPDGSFLVFSSAGSPNSLGASDLYFVQLTAPEWWSAWPWNLGLAVNTREDEVDPCLSADGKRLYFCRSGDIYEIDLLSARQPPAESAVWKNRGDLPTPREWPQAAAANGRIYVYGGMSGGFATGKPHGWNNQVEVYDLATGSWSALAPAPEGWKQASLVVVEDRLVLFRRGGPGVAEYSPRWKRWEVIPGAMPFTIGETSPFQTRTVVLGHKAYTMFAGGQVRDISYLVEYDFDTGVWTPRKSMPFKTAQLVAFEDRLYAFADEVSVYEPGTDQWTVVARMDMPRAESALAVHNSEIWLIGGHGVRADGVDGDICPTVVRFDPRRNAWSRGPALPWLRAAASAVSVNGRLFVLGGLKPGPAFAHDASIMEYLPDT